MTADKIRQVLTLYDLQLSDVEPVRDMSQPMPYVRWMCLQIGSMLDKADVVSGLDHIEMMEKAARWLGFVQGVLWSNGVYTIDEMREHNREPGAVSSV